MVNECYVLCLVFLTSVASVTAVLGDDAQSQDAICLATALMSEASIGTYEERVAVAWTIFNRVSSPEFPNSICDVIHQRYQYATNQAPTQELLDLAESLIANPGTDPTGGAVYFFSPRSMPKEGDNTDGYDVGGGLYDVIGINKKVYFPSFTLTHEYAGDIQGVRPTYYMFYQEQINAEVEEDSEATAAADVVSIGFPVTLTLYVHEGDASGPTISDILVTGEDGAGHSFEQTTNSDGYATIIGISGTWSFSASADGYETNNWDQEITETDTKDASLQEVQHLSESSAVGKWSGYFEGEQTQEGGTTTPFGGDITVEYYSDGTYTEESRDSDGYTIVETGSWTQHGNTIIRQSSEGLTFEEIIEGDNISGTLSRINEMGPFQSRWSVSRVHVGP